VGGANIQIVHYSDHGCLEDVKSMMHSFAVTFGAANLTAMVTSVPPYDIFSLIKNNIFYRYKNYKNHFENSNFGHVTYSFINMLFISA